MIAPKSRGPTRRGGGAIAPHWHVEQNAEKEKYYVFSTFETVLCCGMDSNSDLKHLLKHKFRGEGVNL